MKGTCACFDKDADGEDDDGEEAEQDELIYEVSPLVVALQFARLPLELEAVGSILAHMNVARGPLNKELAILRQRREAYG